MNTAEQQQVVHSPVASLTTVQALAGTGKTHLIAERIEWLVSQQILPQHIAVVCFSRDAAKQIADRLTERKLAGVRVMTLHRLCQQLLHQTQSAGVLATEAQEKALLHSLRQSVIWEDRSDHEGSGDSFVRHLDYLQQTVLPGVRHPPGDVHEVDLQLVTEVHRLLGQQSWYTHTSSLWRSYLLLQSSPHLLENVLPRCAHLISDEFQDVSPLQFELFRLLAAGRSFMAVGDPAQSVYSFQGAQPDLLRRLSKQAAATGQHFELTLNFRCPAHHLLLANSALQLAGEEARLIPTRRPEGRLTIHHFTGHDLPYGLLAQEVRSLLTGLSPSHGTQLAILVRTNEMAAVLGRELFARGIATQLAVRPLSVDGPTVRHVTLPLLRALREMLNTRQEYCPLTAVLDQQGQALVSLSLPARQLLHLAWRTQRMAQEVRELHAQFPEVLEELDFILRIWESLESCTARLIGKSNSEWLGHVEKISRHLWPELFSDQSKMTPLDWQKLLNTTPDEQPLVVISTIHKAKGGEWPHVIFWEGSGATGNGWMPDDWEEGGARPRRIFGGRQEDQAEEARLRYVALTRSTRDLIVFVAKDAPVISRQIFERQAVVQAQQVARLFTAPPTEWEREDQTAFCRLMMTPSPIQRYATETLPGQLPRQTVQELAKILQQADIPLTPQWLLASSLERLTATPVSRLSLERL